MARPRAANYADRRLEILSVAAKLFAEQGYDRTAMTEIAVALGVSKALFYHYYGAKDELLFDIIRNHLFYLVETVEASIVKGLPPEKQLQAIIRAILNCYAGADSEHKVQINHLDKLGAAQQQELKAMQKRLVALMADVVQALRPALPPEMLKPVTMSIFGTLNWKYMWFRESQNFGEEDFITLVTSLFVNGIHGLELSDQR
jgi:TetR/AcrR family transcriptional regulator